MHKPLSFIVNRNTGGHLASAWPSDCGLGEEYQPWGRWGDHHYEEKAVGKESYSFCDFSQMFDVPLMGSRAIRIPSGHVHSGERVSAAG